MSDSDSAAAHGDSPARRASHGPGVPLTAAERAVIVDTWRRHPEASGPEVARYAAGKLNRPTLSSSSVYPLRPADLPPRDEARARARRVAGGQLPGTGPVRDVIVALWHEHPRASGPVIARLASDRLGYPISKWQANGHKPFGREGPPGPDRESAPPPRPAGPQRGLSYRTSDQLETWILEAKRVYRRLFGPRRRPAPTPTQPTPNPNLTPNPEIHS